MSLRNRHPDSKWKKIQGPLRSYVSPNSPRVSHQGLVVTLAVDPWSLKEFEVSLVTLTLRTPLPPRTDTHTDCLRVYDDSDDQPPSVKLWVSRSPEEREIRKSLSSQPPPLSMTKDQVPTLRDFPTLSLTRLLTRKRNERAKTPNPWTLEPSSSLNGFRVLVRTFVTESSYKGLVNTARSPYIRCTIRKFPVGESRRGGEG